MLHTKENLAKTENFVAEIQMAFKTLEDVKNFEVRMKATPGRVFKYANVASTLIPTLTATRSNGDAAIEAIKSIQAYINNEIKNDVCHVIVARVYRVMYAEMYTQPQM